MLVLAEIPKHHGIPYHLYADDGQLYILFDLPTDDKRHILAMVTTTTLACVNEMRISLAMHMLLCNDDKTELMLFASLHKKPIAFPGLQIGSKEIIPSQIARNIGLVMDTGLPFSTHVSNVVSAALFHLKNIVSISDHLSHDAAQTLVHAYVTNKLDYCSSVLYGLPNYPITMLQYVQNSAARLLRSTHKFDHITPVLIQLHKFRIDFKILLLNFKALHNKAHRYICNLINVYEGAFNLGSLAHDNWWNPKPDLCHTVIEHFAKLPISSGIHYQGISDTANVSIVLNAHSIHIC